MLLSSAIDRALAVLTAMASSFVLDMLTRRFTSRATVVVIIVEILLIWNAVDPVIRAWLAPDTLNTQALPLEVAAASDGPAARARKRASRSATARGRSSWAADAATVHWQAVLASSMDFVNLLGLYIVFYIGVAIASSWTRSKPDFAETVFGMVIALIVAFSVLDKVRGLGI